MEEQVMRVRLTFLEEILGTQSGDPNIHENFIAEKVKAGRDADGKQLYKSIVRPEEVEAISVEDAINKAMTIFPRNKNGEPIFWPYQVKGFFKSAQKMLNDFNGKKSEEYLPAYQRKIDLGVFVKATQDEWDGGNTGIVIHLPEGAEMSNCERPLRAETMQGPRVSLANSETCPAGSWIEFDIKAFGPGMIMRVIDWLSYGQYNGLGQWRNAGRGRFTWDEIEHK